MGGFKKGCLRIALLRFNMNIDKKNSCALVLGGHVNGYSIVKELYEQGIKEIVLFDLGHSLARFSNKIKYKSVIDNSSSSLLDELNRLNEKYEFIIVYPTDDLQVENLKSIYKEISGFCYLPFNPLNVLKTSDKFFQYNTCENYDIPYPKSVSATKSSDLESVSFLTYPLLIKPSTRSDLKIKVFRTLYVVDEREFDDRKDELVGLFEKGVELVISEYIPGDDTNIYAYTCFRSHEGGILNEWIGKKLTQYPDNYGVFCSASNEAPDEVLFQGRALVEALDAYGIVEPEFKYDYRDGKYKLMETNLRSMMWHRTGSISGVKLHETQFRYATYKPVNVYQQERTSSIHFVLMLHEIPNLIARKGYWKHFKHNVWGGNQRVWAVFEWRDLKPFLYGNYLLFKRVTVLCLKRLKMR